MGSKHKKECDLKLNKN